MKKPIFFLTLLFAFSHIKAESVLEDSLRRLMVSPKMTSQTVVIQQSNVVFPELLQGNEEKTITYIENFSNNRRDYLIRTYNRGKKYFPKAAEILEKYDVPQEYKVLLALESGFNAKALSKAGAYGYWQLMDKVAKEYGLKIAEKHNAKKAKGRHSSKHSSKKHTIPDQRTDFVRSTHVAARYLKDRMQNLGNNWLLVAASYNWGVGNVMQAIQRSGKDSATYWDIEKFVPAETRAYVLNFIALNVIFNNYENFEDNNLCFKTITEEQPCIAEEDEVFNFQGVFLPVL